MNRNLQNEVDFHFLYGVSLYYHGELKKSKENLFIAKRLNPENKKIKEMHDVKF